MGDYSQIISRRQEVVQRLKLVLIENLMLDLQENEIAEDAPLFGIGLGLDSIDALQFVVGIETEFKVNLPSDDMWIYRSINSMADYLIDSVLGPDAGQYAQGQVNG